MEPIIVGLDIGGANLKAADSTGKAVTQPFALYRNPAGLPDALRQVVSRLATPQAVVVTMTAELCDCFEIRRQGVLSILDSLEEIYNSGILRIWGVDGAFHTTATIRKNPSLAEASNWKALGDYIATEYFADSSGLLIDIGSTTSDILAISHGKLLSESRTDLDRLQSGELVYLGVQRTPICSVVSDLKYRGQKTPIMRELFATTADAYWTLGELGEDAEYFDTANGRPATRGEARHRLARVIGLDVEQFTEEDAEDMASQVDKAILKILEKSKKSVLAKVPDLKIERVVISGSGAFLAERLASKQVKADQILNLQDIWDSSRTSAACAVALVKLAQRKLHR